MEKLPWSHKPIPDPKDKLTAKERFRDLDDLMLLYNRITSNQCYQLLGVSNLFCICGKS